MPEHPAMEQRRRIHEAVQDAIRLEPDYEQATVAGWVLVSELMLPGEDDYELVFAVRSSDATGTSDLRPWTAHGWLAHAVARPDMFEYEEEDDDE